MEQFPINICSEFPLTLPSSNQISRLRGIIRGKGFKKKDLMSEFIFMIFCFGVIACWNSLSQSYLQAKFSKTPGFLEN